MGQAHVISVVNMKGGVGKTTISVALAEALAVMARKKVLVIDLDAQASCTFALVGEAGFSDTSPITGTRSGCSRPSSPRSTTRTSPRRRMSSSCRAGSSSSSAGSRRRRRTSSR